MITFERKWPIWSNRTDKSDLDFVVRLHIPAEKRTVARNDGNRHLNRLHSFSCVCDGLGIDQTGDVVAEFRPGTVFIATENNS